MRRRYPYWLTLSLTCLSLPALALLPAKPQLPAHTRLWTLHAEGYGPIKVGMTVAQAQKLLRIPLLADDDTHSNCYHVSPGEPDPALTFMVRQQHISRVSLYGSSAIHTDRKVQVGDSEQQVLQRYGSSVQITPHHYGEASDHYLTWWRSDKPAHRRGLRFETVNGKVAAIHAGDDSIELVEGCS